MKKPHYEYINRDCTYLSKQVRIEAAIEDMPRGDEWTVTYRCEFPHCPMKKDCDHIKKDIEHYPKITTPLSEVIREIKNHV